jgi:hypothetical protein
MIEREAWEWLRRVHAGLISDTDPAMRARIEAEERIIDQHEGCREMMLASDPPLGWSNDGVTFYAMAMHWCVSRVVEGWRHHPGFNSEWLD